ncbi:MAG: hypothetical protein ACLUGP_00395 [Faecalibacterium prausnitzii]
MNAVRSDSVDFFLGTTTPAGFKGYFEPLRQEPGMQMYLIKSGPGCGKSTLMKRLAVKAEQKGSLSSASTAPATPTVWTASSFSTSAPPSWTPPHPMSWSRTPRAQRSRW